MYFPFSMISVRLSPSPVLKLCRTSPPHPFPGEASLKSFNEKRLLRIHQKTQLWLHCTSPSTHIWQHGCSAQTSHGSWMWGSEVPWPTMLTSHLDKAALKTRVSIFCRFAVGKIDLVPAGINVLHVQSQWMNWEAADRKDGVVTGSRS